MPTRMMSRLSQQWLQPLGRCACSASVRGRYPRPIEPYSGRIGGHSFSTNHSVWAKKKAGGSQNPSSTEGQAEKERFDRGQVDNQMALTVDRLRKNINVIVNRVGRLTPAYLDPVFVLHRGQRQKLDSVAQVIVHDPSTLSIAPYDPSYTKSIEQALYGSALNLAPKLQPDGSLRISIPRLTIEVRQTLAKESGQLCEQARAGLRNIRQAAQKSSKTDLDSNLITKDDFKANQKTLDEVSRVYTKLIDGLEAKSKAVLLDK